MALAKCDKLATCSDDVVGVGILSEFGRDDAHAILGMHQLMSVQHFEGVLVDDQQRINLPKDENNN